MGISVWGSGSSLHLRVAMKPTRESSDYEATTASYSDSESDEDLQVGSKPDEVERKLESLKKPPPKRDVDFFVGAGLSDKGFNPHRLKCGREVSKAALEAVFGREAARSNYRYTDARDERIRERVEKIWPLCYGRADMDGVKLISLEFAMGIVYESTKKSVDWARFAEETNRTQRSKYQKRVNKILGDAAKDGIRVSSAKVKLEKEYVHSQGCENREALHFLDFCRLARVNWRCYKPPKSKH